MRLDAVGSSFAFFTASWIPPKFRASAVFLIRKIKFCPPTPCEEEGDRTLQHYHGTMVSISLPVTIESSKSLFAKLAKLAQKIGQMLLVPPVFKRVNQTATATATAFSNNYSQYGTHKIYPTLGLIGALIVVGLYFIQYQSHLRHSWIPDIARVKELAVRRIQEATNGGWSVLHLRDAVVEAADNGMPHTTRRHLERNIWPEVLDQLDADARICRSEMTTRSGKRQIILSWAGGEEEDSEEESDEYLDTDDPLRTAPQVAFENTTDRDEEKNASEHGRGVIRRVGFGSWDRDDHDGRLDRARLGLYR